jgi:hypothetical protein
MGLDVQIVAGMVILFADICRCRKFGTKLEAFNDVFFCKLANGIPVHLSGRGPPHCRVHADNKGTTHFF